MLLFDFLKFFFENFFVKNWRFFFLIFFSLLLTSFYIKNSKNVYLLYKKKYPHFNMHFLPFQNSLFSQCKKWKIEKIEFFVPIVCTPKIFLWDNSLMLCCSPKIFSWCLNTFWISKILFKKHFPEKKAIMIPQKFREKKFWKKSGNPNIWPIGRNRPNIFGGQICGYYADMPHKYLVI